MRLKFLVCNYISKTYREETLNGRNYLVTPMTMIVPGVLVGSKGRLFYPPEEVGKDPTPWNGIPITYYHPTKNGKPVSAKEVDENDIIGVVKKSTTSNNLRAEAWIDKSKADLKDKRIVESIQNGTPMEISTGLYTDNFAAPAGSHWQGKKYDFIARNYRPDHLAILPDQKGACSVNDGCGLGINQDSTLIANDWAKWNALHKAKGTTAEGHRKAAIGHETAYRSAKQKGNIGHVPAGTAEKHRMLAEAHKRAYREATAKPATLPKTTKSNAKVDAKGKLQFKAAELAQKHAEGKADTRKFAAALVKAHLDASKAHTKAGNTKSAAKAHANALQAAVGYSKTRASQHEKTSDAYAKAGNKEMAAHYKARAAFHHAHVSKISGSTRNELSLNEYMPTGEREYVTHQKEIDMSQIKEVKFFITDNAVSHEEVRGKLETALRSKLTQNDPQPYIHEVHDDHIKYDHGGQMKKCAYKMTDNDGVKLGKPKNLKRVVSYEEAESDADEVMNRKAIGTPQIATYKQIKSHDPANNSTGDGKSAVDNSTRKGGTMAKLTANQRTAVIDQLISNEGCGCFKEEDKEFLQGLSDNRLSDLQASHEKHLATNASPEDEDDDEDKVQTKDKGDKVSNKAADQPKKRMTINEFRDTAPPEYLEAVDDALRVVNEKKTTVINKLTKHIKDEAVKTRLVVNLQKESLTALEDRLLLIPEPPKQTQQPLRPVFGPTGNAVTDDPVSNEEENVKEMSQMGKIDWQELSKQNDSRHRFANQN